MGLTLEQEASHEQCDRCGNLYELVDIVFLYESGFLCVGCLVATRRKSDFHRFKSPMDQAVEDWRKWQYARLRKKFLAAHPTCEFCGIAPATVVEHTKGRREHYLDVSTFKAACKPCEKLHGFDGRKPTKTKKGE